MNLKSIFKKLLLSLTLLGGIVSTNLEAKEQDIAALHKAAVHNPYHQNNWSQEQKEVWRVIESWNDAFARNDPDTYFTFIADEITLVLPSGPYRVEGKPDDQEEFEFLLGKGFTKVGFFQEMQPQITVIGDMAFVSYYSRGFYGEVEGQMAYFKETTILKKTSEGWKIIHIHLSK